MIKETLTIAGRGRFVVLDTAPPEAQIESEVKPSGPIRTDTSQLAHPEGIVESYRSGKILDIEDQLARDIQRADQYIKERVKQGMSELEAEDRAVELILAPSDGPEFSDHPPTPVQEPLRSEIIDRIETLEEGFAR